MRHPEAMMARMNRAWIRFIWYSCRDKLKCPAPMGRDNRDIRDIPKGICPECPGKNPHLQGERDSGTDRDKMKMSRMSRLIIVGIRGQKLIGKCWFDDFEA